MKGPTATRRTSSRVRRGLCVPPCSPTVNGTTLRSHLQNLLDGLPQDLPTYYHDALLDDICFLLCSPLFFYAISPRIRKGEQKPGSSANRIATTRAPTSKSTHSRVTDEPKTELDMTKLRMEITRDKEGWVTRLLYNTATLIEGRERLPPKDTGFVHSFRFFCEEVEFLGCEFRAREHAAALTLGTAIDEVITSAQVADEQKRKRRLAKLKIRFRMLRGKAVRAGKTAR